MQEQATPFWRAGPTDAPLPPLLPGLPVFGSLFDLLDDILPFLQRGYAQLGPAYRVRALGSELTVLAGPEANRLLSRGGDEYLSVEETYRGIAQAMDSRWFILGLDGDRHREVRRLLKRGYSKQIGFQQLATLAALTREEIQSWRPGQIVPLVPFFKRLITRQLGVLLLRRAPDEYLDDLQVFFTVSAEVAVARTKPRLWLHTPRYRRARRRVLELTERVVQEHRAAAGNGHAPDILDDVLAERARPESQIADDIINAVAIGSYIAGIDTVALTCCFLVYALLHHEGVIEQVQPDVDRFDGGHPEPHAALRGMRHLHAAMLESLRMYPVAPAAPRTARQTFEFAGRRVPAGAQLIVATGVTHFLPEFFPEPGAFKLERYLGARGEHQQAGMFAPFSLGEHTCLGAGLAEVQVAATVATILQSARLSLHPADYRLKIKTAPTRGPRHDFAVRVEARR
jgi:cytochrome P450